MNAAGEQIIKCAKCNAGRTPDEYKLNRHGLPLKTCMQCNERRMPPQRCVHKRIKATCVECKGVSICDHLKQRSRCAICIADRPPKIDRTCTHGYSRYSACPTCDPGGVLAAKVKNHIIYAIDLVHHQDDYVEHLGCDIGTFRLHIEKQFTEGMNWCNRGLWHFDHIIAIKAPNANGDPPTIDDVIPRLHYTNLQPLWAKDNMIKGTN